MSEVIKEEKQVKACKAELPKEIEKAMFHAKNDMLYNEGVISKEIYEKAKVLIDRL